MHSSAKAGQGRAGHACTGRAAAGRGGATAVRAAAAAPRAGTAARAAGVGAASLAGSMSGARGAGEPLSSDTRSVLASSAMVRSSELSSSLNSSLHAPLVSVLPQAQHQDAGALLPCSLALPA